MVGSIDIVGPDGRRLAAGSKAPKGARYRARWRTPGGASRTRTFARKFDAELFLAGTEHTKSESRYIDPSAGRERFGAFAARWAQGQDWKESTRESFGQHLRRISRHLGDMTIGDVDKLDLERTRRALLDAGYARSTVTISLHYATTIMRAAHHAGLVPRDPTLGVKPPRRRTGDPDGRVGPDDVPTRAEVLAILAAAPDRFRASVALGIAGLRNSEMLAVTADRLDVDRRRLLIDRQRQMLDGVMVLTGPKREKVRTIELPSVTVLEWRRHLHDHHSDGLLFREARGADLRRDSFYEVGLAPGAPQRRSARAKAPVPLAAPFRGLVDAGGRSADHSRGRASGRHRRDDLQGVSALAS